MSKKVTNALIIMDGFGLRRDVRGNAVVAQGTPYINSLMKKYPHIQIEASGRAVGLPAGQMGNSEVGHLNLGAGRVVYQDITMIDKSIEDGDFFTNAALKGAMDNAQQGKSLHLVGLLSDGGVHSSIAHLFALLKMAKNCGVQKVYVHCITDGRDVPPDSGASFIEKLEDVIKREGIGQIATVVGRYYYMDRDNRWERVEKGYNCVFAGEGVKYTNAKAGIMASYAEGKTDEFVEPIVVGDYKGVREGDSVIFYNFRSDRAREITRAATFPDFTEFQRKGGFKPTYYVGMTQYDATFKNIHTAYPPKDIVNTLGAYLAQNKLTQARIAETEKYAHVTFFFNGGVEKPNDGETRVLVPSPKVATYDLKPEMSAYEVTDKALETIQEGVDVLILNYANCDMVGHTGVMKAAVKAVETVDNCLSRLIPEVLKTGGSVLLTADHGNAEQMSFDDGAPCTSHTTNPVPFVLVSDTVKAALKENGALCDVAPTLLELIGIEKPIEMSGQSLLKK